MTAPARQTVAAGYAFFDVDDTLISVKSLLRFQEYWYEATGDVAGRAAYEADMADLRRSDASWEILNRRFYRHFAGRSVAEVETRGYAWFRLVEASTPNLFHGPVVDCLRRHQEAGEEAVFVSGSFPAVLRPVAERLGVRHVLATTMEVADGRYTGEILAPQTIGAGKAVAVGAFLRRRGVRAEDCHAYGDDISDLALLEAVGHPTAVRGGRGLEALAAARGWRIISPS